jgi:hypothetical protein
MSKNIFKNSSTTKNTSNKGNNNRFSSLKDELNETPSIGQYTATGMVLCKLVVDESLQLELFLLQ